MTHTISYDIDEKMSRDSLSQYLLTVHLRPKIPLFALILIYFIAILFIDFRYKDWMVVALGVVILFLVTAWIKTYFTLQAQGRDGLKLLSHPKITINLTDDIVEYSSSTGTRRHEWNKIDRFCETTDFMVFQSGKIPLLILPKKPLSPDSYMFIKEKTKGLKSPATR